MTSNLQTRSASISSPVKENETLGKVHAIPKLDGKSNPLRSVSMSGGGSVGGSSFFHKDTSNFFKSEATPVGSVSGGSAGDLVAGAVDLSPSMSANPPTSADLDFVGALGNLDLDDDYDVSNGGKESNGSSDDKDAVDTTSLQYQNHLQNQPLVYGDFNLQFYPYGLQHQGSLTPNNAGPFGQSAFIQGNTPSSTWRNTYVPSSAPPFSYNNANSAGMNNANSKAKMNSNDFALSVKPFELPEDRVKKDATPDVLQSLHQFSTSPNNLGFGGSLSHIPIGISPYGTVSDTQHKIDGSSPESEVDSSFQTDAISTPIGHQSLASRSFSVSNTPTSTIDFQTIGGSNDGKPNNANNVISTSELVHRQLLNEGFSFPYQGMMSPPQLNNAWNQNQHSVSGRPPLQAMFSTVTNQGLKIYNDNNRTPAPHYGGAASHRYHNHRRNGHDSDSNRKMHGGNRRKGEESARYANAVLEDFVGNIFSLCKDQHGCRFLQRQLDISRDSENRKVKGDLVAATLIFNEIYLKIVELMTDPFGNYLVQKLFENVTSDQRTILVKNAAPHFVKIALDPHGTRALQKLIECISTDEESDILIASFAPHVVSLSTDLNGNHVVQKCLQKLESKLNQFIFDAAAPYCKEIATHRHGCCVLQRCLDHGNELQRKQLSLKVSENVTSLSLDPFGNYVVQYVLAKGDDESIELIFRTITANIMSLSLHKFGSNVIEKSLRIRKLTDTLIEELLKHQDRFSDLLSDPFGNYVLQTSLDVANGSQATRLSEALLPLLLNIRNTPHGRRIMAKLQPIV
ncbi:uncharacterized protein PRCAT00003064001 [Priceomyces carsonii]|uniref:uncharacterized protein n=1 Tax=Priceomyces carsonii TaxID=28549 RepID=UPI002EDA7043|nr:unnamed protein product [Priceomyces carsonii]